jgi:hypothetical protein
MKSIMEEASSIVKAIEKGWTNAGKPKEFSIKIFEEPQKNFIGMTVKPAKIGIFFTEPAPARAAETGRTKRARPIQQKEEPLRPEPRRQQRERPQKPSEAPRREVPVAELEERGPVWNDQMIASAKEWISGVLSMIDLGHVPFTVEPERFHLKIQFKEKLYDDKNKEKHLFASLSHLILTMLKRANKRPLKGYKIVLLGA